MSFFEIFSPGIRHVQEQKDFDKVRVLEAVNGEKDPNRRHGIDLKRGVAVIRAAKKKSQAED